MFFYIACDCKKASDVAPTATPTTARDGETDFEYEARRLLEQRAMIAETMRLAEEEEQKQWRKRL